MTPRENLNKMLCEAIANGGGGYNISDQVDKIIDLLVEVVEEKLTEPVLIGVDMAKREEIKIGGAKHPGEPYAQTVPYQREQEDLQTGDKFNALDTKDM